MVTVYILLCSDRSYYTGMSANLDRRIRQHTAGGCSYTKSRLPIIPVFTQVMKNYKHARWLEKKIKHFGAQKWLRIYNCLYAESILYVKNF